jgi:hypothetical protein
MDWKEFERNRSWPNFMRYPGISLEGLKETTIPSVRIPCLRAEI